MWDPSSERSRRLSRWWQRDTAHIYKPYLHESCTAHKQYWLTCSQFDGLILRSNNGCEICDRPHVENPGHVPYIDHDHDWGMWAVRGLLCQPCNSALHCPSMAERRAVYLAKSWYVAILNERGVPLTVPPEPPIGSFAIDVADRLRVRRDDGWYSHQGNRWHNRHQPWTWEQWALEVGPHNLRLVSETSAVTA